MRAKRDAAVPQLLTHLGDARFERGPFDGNVEVADPDVEERVIRPADPHRLLPAGAVRRVCRWIRRFRHDDAAHYTG